MTEVPDDDTDPDPDSRYEQPGDDQTTFVPLLFPRIAHSERFRAAVHRSTTPTTGILVGGKGELYKE